MRIMIQQQLDESLVLPINYSHILQGIIYNNLSHSYGFGSYIHNQGFAYDKRQFKLFTYSLLQGRYEIKNKKIIFREQVSFEISSPEIFMIQMLAESFSRNGIRYGDRHIQDVKVYISDETVETEEMQVRMLSPICVYSTLENKQTYFYNPMEQEFRQMINDNFVRKYEACYGVAPEGGIELMPVKVIEKDKYIVQYKNFYITGWMGQYALRGPRKYLDFLYQAGIGSKNSQGFGMMQLIDE